MRDPVVGVAIALVGAVITTYGLAMFVDYRGAARRYWWGVWGWHEQWSPVWRWRGRTAEQAMVERPAFQRYLGAAVFSVTGIGGLCIGFGLMTGHLRG